MHSFSQRAALTTSRRQSPAVDNAEGRDAEGENPALLLKSKALSLLSKLSVLWRVKNTAIGIKVVPEQLFLNRTIFYPPKKALEPEHDFKHRSLQPVLTQAFGREMCTASRSLRR